MIKLIILFLLLSNSAICQTNDNETIFQYFEWDLPNDGSLWKQLEDQAEALSDRGITAVWIPPAYKNAAQNYVGYGPYDHYDLGEFEQKGTIRTKYGTKKELISAIDRLHKFKVKVYGDVVMNHLMGADQNRWVQTSRANPWQRLETIEEDVWLEIPSYFGFKGRLSQPIGSSYSDIKLGPDDFDGISMGSDSEGRPNIYLFAGKGWDYRVSREHSNYDYLMGLDLDFDSPKVAKYMKEWGQWFTNELDLDGYRIDAAKHIKFSYLKDWVEHQRESKGQIFAVAEYLSTDRTELLEYINETDGTMHVMDFPLELNFSRASRDQKYQLTSLFEGSLSQKAPDHAVTMVGSHDTQPGQVFSGKEVLPWFKPHAYTFILTRKEGIPIVFYGDYYGIPTSNRPPLQSKLDRILLARKHFSYGEQRNFFNHEERIGWTREGDAEHPGSGLAALISNGSSGFKNMYVGSRHNGETWIDLTGNQEAKVQITNDGWGRFPVGERSYSIFVPTTAESLKN